MAVVAEKRVSQNEKNINALGNIFFSKSCKKGIGINC